MNIKHYFFLLGGLCFALQAAARDSSERSMLPDSDIQNPEGSIKHYSINLMWLNSTHNSHRYLGFDTESNTYHRILEPVIKWAKANPDADVALWYDSVYTSPEQLKNTRHILEKQAVKEHLKHVRMRDVRNIPIIAKNSDAFSHFLPIYFRVDILKPIILVNSIEAEHNNAAIFSDLEVGDLRVHKDRMNKAELFSPKIMDRLDTYAMVLNCGLGCTQAENQFLQLLNNPVMIQAIKEAIVNVNLYRAKAALDDGREWYPKLLAQIVYSPSTVSDVYKYFLATKEGKPLQARLKVREEGLNAPLETYTIAQDGYWPFGSSVNRDGATPLIPLPGEDLVPYDEVLEFPFEFKKIWVTRAVQVRNSKQAALKTDIIPTPPANGKEYQVTYWK